MKFTDPEWRDIMSSLPENDNLAHDLIVIINHMLDHYEGDEDDEIEIKFTGSQERMISAYCFPLWREDQ